MTTCENLGFKVSTIESDKVRADIMDRMKATKQDISWVELFAQSGKSSQAEF